MNFIIGFVSCLFCFLLSKKIASYIVRSPFVPDTLEEFFSQVIRFFIIGFGVVFFSLLAGLDLSAILTGLGLTSLIFGLALKDILANLAAGVLILLYKPFLIGYNIEIGDAQGKVISIDLRQVVLKKDNKLILVPNSKILTEVITISK